MKRILLFTLLHFVIFTLCEAQDADAKYAINLLKPGTEAPAFRLKNTEGKWQKYPSRQTQGNYVVLSFWASWCPDCRKDIPDLVRIHDKFAPLGVDFVNVSFDTDADAWRRTIEKYQLIDEYIHVSPLQRMGDSQVAKDYGVEWIPTTYLIGPDGKVVLATVLNYKIEKKLTELFATPREYGEKEKVSIDGDHGKLAAVIQKPIGLQPGQRIPMVMLCHGFGGNKEGQMFDLIADSLSAHGIASIRFDFNAHGESEGDFQDMTVPNEIVDARHVYEYVRDLRYVGDIAIVGHSQGGVVAAMSAGQMAEEAAPEDVPPISAVALMAPAGVLRDDAIRGTVFGKSYDPFNLPEYLDLWGKRLGQGYARTAFRLPIYETAAHYQGPAIIVHGTGDRIVPYTYGLRFHQQWLGSEYLELEAFDHGFSQNIYRACTAVSDFLIRTLCR